MPVIHYLCNFSLLHLIVIQAVLTFVPGLLERDYLAKTAASKKSISILVGLSSLAHPGEEMKPRLEYAVRETFFLLLDQHYLSF